MTTATQTPAAATPSAPPADPDAARYDELRKELGIQEEAAPEPSEPTAEAAPEPGAEPTEPAGKAKPEHVPYADYENLQRALKESRDAAKHEGARTDAIIAALREAQSRRGQEAAPEKQSAAPKMPDLREDPLGHVEARFAQIEEAMRQGHLGGQQQTQQIQAHLQEQALWHTVSQSEAAIRDPRSGEAHKADYDDACTFLESSRVRQLDRMYPSSSPQLQTWCRQQGYKDANEYKLSLLNQDRRNVAMHALQAGMSPAQLYYDLALDSGYQPKANGKAPAPAPLAERAQQQIDAAKKGAKASVTLSGGGSSRKASDEMSIDDLARLYTENPDEADRVWEIMRKAGKLG
jgi:hypothetical protein